MSGALLNLWRLKIKVYKIIPSLTTKKKIHTEVELKNQYINYNEILKHIEIIHKKAEMGEQRNKTKQKRK